MSNGEDENETPTPVLSWITAEDAVERHGVDPVGRTGIRNKLAQRGAGHFIRVFLEDDVRAAKGKTP